MSTFEGKMLEQTMDFIRIDNFQSTNYDGSAFFLSHFHTDHMRGLFYSDFMKMLAEEDDKMLYCSPFTKYMTLNKNRGCKIPQEKICAMEVNATQIIHHKGRESVQVTAIPAGHCPGSVMFLFEQGETCVLYTGDFRIDPNDFNKIRVLHDKTGKLKKIDTLYLDTTFCHPKWLSFPSRNQTLEDLAGLVENWLSKSGINEVGIWYNSYHGLEPLLILISQRVKEIIGVPDEMSYANYSCIPELDQVITDDPCLARIHLCPVSTQNNCVCCSRMRNYVLTIKPCAQTFTQQQLEKSRVLKGRNVVRVAFSTHCSLEELVEIVKYLKPKTVYPCALPTNTSHEQVLQNLQLNILKLKSQEKENLLTSTVVSGEQKSLLSPLSESDSDSVSTTTEPDSPPAKRLCTSKVFENTNLATVQSIVQKVSLNDTDILSSDSIEVIEEPPIQSDSLENDSPPL